MIMIPTRFSRRRSWIARQEGDQPRKLRSGPTRISLTGAVQLPSIFRRIVSASRDKLTIFSTRIRVRGLFVRLVCDIIDHAGPVHELLCFHGCRSGTLLNAGE